MADDDEAPPTREQIYSALFALVTPLLAPGAIAASDGNDAVAGVPSSDRPFNCITREVIEVQRIPPGLQPVLMLYEMNEDFGDSGDELAPLRFTVIFIIGATSGKGTPGQAVLNPLIDLVIATLQPELPDEVQTLGGLVERVQIKGTAGKDHGNHSTAGVRQAAYYLPVEITLPSP